MCAFRRRILVVEDEAIIAALLQQVLQSAGFDVGVASDVVGARALADEFDPDAALLDIDLGPGPSGLDLAHVLRRRYAHLAIIFLTRAPNLRSAGLSPDRIPADCGFLRKDMIGDAGYLLEAIDAVLTDQPGDYRHDLSTQRPLPQLTSAQFEALRLASQGLTNAGIAQVRGVSERAVEKVLQAAFARLGISVTGEVNPRVEAVRRYVQEVGLPSRAV